MKQIIITLILLSSTQLYGQAYISLSTDPNVMTGNKYSMNDTPTLHYKVDMGYTFNRLTIKKSFENLPKFKFSKYALTAEYVVIDFDRFDKLKKYKYLKALKNIETTFNLGYGRIYREFKDHGSYNLGGKITYNLGKLGVFAEYSIDGRPELTGDDKGHLRGKGKYQYVRSVLGGVSYRFNLIRK